MFSKALTETMEIAAVEGSFASVIGGAPAAATVFAREVKRRVERDPRVETARAEAASASGPEATALRARAARVVEEVRSHKLHDVADEFDAIHTIERALRVGSVDRIIPASTLRPYVVDALERGMSRARRGAGPRGYCGGMTSGRPTQLCTGVARARSAAPGSTRGGSRSCPAATVRR